MYTRSDMMAQAKGAGAVAYRTYNIDVLRRRYGVLATETEIFSYHFFDEKDREVGYVVWDMKDVSGMIVFIEPRIWSKAFKEHNGYSRLTKI
jgi:hypothetical protein